MNDVNILPSQSNMLRNVNDAFSDENSAWCSVYNIDTLSTHETNIINIPYLGDVNVISTEMSSNYESSQTDVPKMSTSGHHTVYTENYLHSLQYNESLNGPESHNTCSPTVTTPVVKQNSIPVRITERKKKQITFLIATQISFRDSNVNTRNVFVC
jgi:hypothetical protein